MSRRKRTKKKAKSSVKTKKKAVQAAVLKTEKKKVSGKSSIFEWFFENYKTVVFIPILLLIVSIAIIGFQVSRTGNLIYMGVSLSGGTEVSIPASINLSSERLESYFKTNYPSSDTNVRDIYNFGTLSYYLLDTTEKNVSVIKQALIKFDPAFRDQMSSVSFSSIGAQLGQAFFKQIMWALLIAFLFMAIVVFLRFRAFITSLAVILSAFSDIVMTVAFLDIIHFRLSTGGIAALLMLIGYSVDTDILLSTRMLKGKGTYVERLKSSFFTGITMTLTTMVTVFGVYFITNSTVIQEIMFIIGIGLCADLLNTWFQNAGFLVWYVKKKKL